MASEKHPSTESLLRDEKVPHFETSLEMLDYIEALVDRPHDYGTCVYAMSMAAVAAYNYVAHKLDVSGFQASCADLDILRRTRGVEAGILLNFNDALYPQYSLHGKLDEALGDAKPWLSEQAKKLLDESAEDAVPSVVAHWQSLAAA